MQRNVSVKIQEVRVSLSLMEMRKREALLYLVGRTRMLARGWTRDILRIFTFPTRIAAANGVGLREPEP